MKFNGSPRALALICVVAAGGAAAHFARSQTTGDAEIAAPDAPKRVPRPRLVQSQTGPLTHSKEAYDFCNQFNALFDAGRYDAAMKLAQAWQTAHPGDPDGAANIGRSLSMRGDFEGAIKQGRAAIAADARYQPIVRPWLDEAIAIRRAYPKLQLFPLVPRVSTQKTENAAIENQAQTLLRAGKYDEIERVAASYLASRAEMPDGSWKLTSFAYGLFSVYGQGEAAWQANHARMEAWHAARPQSKLARLLLGRSWSEGAWGARGAEYADKVQSKQWAIVQQRLHGAAPLLSASLADIKSTPLVFSGLQSWALLGQVPRPVYERAWKQALAAFPTYTPFYLAKSNYLMPRWGGEAGEWEAFAAQSADALGGTRGDILYARLVEDQSESYGDEFFEVNAPSYERARRGYHALLKISRDPVTDASRAQRLANLADDTAFQRELFQGPLLHGFVPFVNFKYQPLATQQRRVSQQRIFVFGPGQQEQADKPSQEPAQDEDAPPAAA